MFLCADLDAFFVAVEQARQPALQGKPVIVGGRPGERGVVASASYEARAFGIHAGMPISRAYQLCPRGVFLTPCFPAYERSSEAFREILQRYSPNVEMGSIDEAFVDISGTERLFGPPLIIASKIKQETVRELNLHVSIGIARTRPLAKIACDHSKPDGLILLPPEEETRFLEPLPVNVIPGIGPKTYEVLQSLNINTVGELLQAPDWVVSTALGNAAPLVQYLFTGDGSRHEARTRSISHETTLAEDTLDQNLIRSVLYQLTDQVCRRVRAAHFTASVITLKIRFADFKTITRRLTLPESTKSQQTVYHQVLPLVQDALKERKRIRLLGIALSRFEYDGQQISLFQTRENRLNRLNYALDKARARFGPACLCSGGTFEGMQRHDRS